MKQKLRNIRTIMRNAKSKSNYIVYNKTDSQKLSFFNQGMKQGTEKSRITVYDTYLSRET